MPISLELCEVSDGYMARAAHFLSFMKHPEGETRMYEMMKATEEADANAERLEAVCRALGQRLGDNPLHDLST